MKWSDYTNQMDTVHAPESLKARIRALAEDSDPLDAPKMQAPRRTSVFRLPKMKILSVAAALVLCAGIVAVAPTTIQMFHTSASQPNESMFFHGATDGASEDSAPAPQDSIADLAEGSSQKNLARSVPDRKMVYTSDLLLESKEYEQTRLKLDEILAQADGYAQRTEESTHTNDTRYLYCVYRIPSENYRTFLDQIADSGNLVHRDEQQNDVTSNYIDTQARLTALTSQRDRLLELQEKAEDLSALLEIETKLTQVQYELESWQQKLNDLSNQVEYCTVNLTLQEVTTYTPGETPLWQKISSAFVDAVKNFGAALSVLLLAIISFWPWLVVLGLAGGIAYWLHKKHRKPSAK